MEHDPHGASQPRRSVSPIFDAIAALVAAIAGVGLVALTAMVMAEVISRSFFHVSLDFVQEFTGYLVAAVTFLGAALALRENALFRVGFLFDALPAGLRRRLGYLYLAFSACIGGILIWQTTRLVLSSYSRGNVAPSSLMTPLWMPQLLLPVGLSVIMVFLLEKAIGELRFGSAG